MWAPKILFERDERALARVSVVNPKKTAQEIRTSVGSSASISIVKRALRRHGRLAFRLRKAPSLNAAQQRTRLKWCLQFQHWDEEKWKNMFWVPSMAVDPCPLVPINCTMSAQKYINTLEHHIVPFLEDQSLSEAYVFMQDNAPSHKAHLTRNYLLAKF
ncbi:unnamed protein product [Sphagnum jensenii]|uniref:Transposase Tc1-like domain-containing protein n=1 Tax=Sphagnum jensenii TaxID=128206 RepID=A0ABP0V8C1_9BRYO